MTFGVGGRTSVDFLTFRHKTSSNPWHILSNNLTAGDYAAAKQLSSTSLLVTKPSDRVTIMSVSPQHISASPEVAPCATVAADFVRLSAFVLAHCVDCAGTELTTSDVECAAIVPNNTGSAVAKMGLRATICDTDLVALAVAFAAGQTLAYSASAAALLVRILRHYARNSTACTYADVFRKRRRLRVAAQNTVVALGARCVVRVYTATETNCNAKTYKAQLCLHQTSSSSSGASATPLPEAHCRSPCASPSPSFPALCLRPPRLLP